MAAADLEGGNKTRAGHMSLKHILNVQQETLNSSQESMLEMKTQVSKVKM